MRINTKAILWAGAIITAALISVGLGLSDGASLGVIGGLSGAAWGSLSAKSACGRSCW